MKWSLNMLKVNILLYVILVLIMLVSSAQAVSESYSKGEKSTCYDDGICSVENYHTYTRWDGVERPFEEFNMMGGTGYYYPSENVTHYDLVRLDKRLSLPKNFANYTFDRTKISFEFTVTPTQLGARSVANGSGQWYILIPEKAAKTRFLWDNKKPIITNESGATLGESNYWYYIVNNQIRLNYNQIARNFGIASTNITFLFDSWEICGSGCDASWSGNSSFNNTALTGDNDNNVVIGLVADYFNRTSTDGSTGTYWNESVTTIGINNSKLMYKTAGWIYPSVINTNTSYYSNYNISFSLNEIDGNMTNTDFRPTVVFYRQTTSTGYYDAGYKLTFIPNLGLVRFYNSTGVADNIIGDQQTAVGYNSSDVITIDTSTVGTGLKVSKNGLIWFTINAGSSAWNGGYVGFSLTSAVAGEEYNVDNFRIWNTTIGNLTAWHDAGNGNETYQLDVNVSTTGFPNVNYSVYYRQNQTGNMVLLGSNQSGNSSYALSTKYQDTEVNVTLYSNVTASPELMKIKFWSQAVSGDGAVSNLTRSYVQPARQYRRDNQ